MNIGTLVLGAMLIVGVSSAMKAITNAPSAQGAHCTRLAGPASHSAVATARTR